MSYADHTRILPNRFSASLLEIRQALRKFIGQMLIGTEQNNKPDSSAGLLFCILIVTLGFWLISFVYTGKHYQVKDAEFTPVPVQSPRIPIWVAGNWPHKGPFRRAARWDGMNPQVDPKQGDELSQLKAAIQYAQGQRQNKGTFDVVFSTSLLPGNHIHSFGERIAQYKEIGITWLLEQLYPEHFGGEWQGNWPVEAMRQRILQGPPAL